MYVKKVRFTASDYSGHSIRIGAATTVAIMGLEDSDIQTRADEKVHHTNDISDKTLTFWHHYQFYYQLWPRVIPYSKQQKLSRRTLSWFLRIFDELQKFSLPIDRHCTIDIIMEAKSRRFSHKSYQTVIETFLPLNFCCLWYLTLGTVRRAF